MPRLKKKSQEQRVREVKKIIGRLRLDEKYTEKCRVINAECQRNRLKNKHNLMVHKGRLKASQRKRLKNKNNQLIHKSRLKACQIERLRNQNNRNIHKKRLRIAQEKRLSKQDFRLHHNIINSKAQAKRLCILENRIKQQCRTKLCQSKRLANQNNRRVHQIRLKISQEKRLSKQDYRLHHNFINSKAQTKRLCIQENRIKQQCRTKLCQSKRLADQNNRMVHQIRLKIAQEKRLSKHEYRLRHNLKNRTTQRKRLSINENRMRHRRSLILSQKKRLENKQSRSQHNMLQKQNQMLRLKNPSNHQAHKENSLMAFHSRCNSIKRRQTAKKYDKYLRDIKEGPHYKCASCGRLWFSSSVTYYTFDQMESKGITREFLTETCPEHESESIVGYLCAVCKKNILKSKIPPLSLCKKELVFPQIPESILMLTALEERFVAPRIPFMKIQSLSHAGQFAIHGRVVNVPIDVPSSVAILPRLPHETDFIPIALKKKKSFKSNYLFESVRPNVVLNAVNDLENSEVYKIANIVIDRNRFKNMHAQTMNGDTCLNNSIINNVVRTNNSGTHDLDPAIDVQQVDVDNVFVENKQWEGEQSNNILNGNSKNCHDLDTDFDVEEQEPDNIPAEETLLQPNVLVFAPGEGHVPIPILTDEHAESMSFIKLYGGNIRKIPDNTSYQDWVKSEITRSDRRCCSLPKLFYSSTKLRLKKLTQSISFCLRQTKGKPNVTAGQLLDPNIINEIVTHDSGYKVFATDRGSPSFWEVKKKEIFAMLRQLGPPTFFMTLSAAETRWPELLVILKGIVDNEVISETEALELPFSEKCRLIQKDPITCSRYFDYRIRKLFQIIRIKNRVFEDHSVIDQYIRIEFQQRGSPHVHCLLWLTNAPLFKENDEENNKQCCTFVDKFISCSSNLEREDLKTFQTHKHSFSCKKVSKSGISCRFGIPFYPMRETAILSPLSDALGIEERIKLKKDLKVIDDFLQTIFKGKEECQMFDDFLIKISMTETDYIRAVRFSLKRTTVCLKRSPTDVKMNPYNETILNLHSANMDIQFITDMYSCVQYILNYINKSKRGVSKALHDAMEEIKQGDFSIKHKLKHLSNKFLNASEFSAQEAVYFLLGMPLSKCSRASIFINTNIPEKRVAVVKANKELTKLDANSTDVVAKNLIDYYVQRPDKLDKICLAEFAADYEYSKVKRKTSAKFLKTQDEEQVDSCSEAENDLKKPSFKLKNSMGYVYKRNRSKIIRYVRFHKEQNESDYYREQVMLFLPWHDEQTDIINIDCKQVYFDNSTKLHHNKMKFVHSDEYDSTDFNAVEQEVLKKRFPDIMDINENGNEYDILNDRTDEGDFHIPDIEKDIGLEQNKDNLHTIPVPKLIPEDLFLSKVRLLNEKQRKYLIHILHLLKNDINGVHECVIGGAGVGKSVLIECIEQALVRHYNSIPGTNIDDLKVLLCAPTGKAAFGIKGITLHSAFVLPLNQTSGEMTPLSSSTCNTLYATMHSLKLIIVDEISMVGCRMLGQIDSRLRQIFKEDTPFGNKNIILFGDFNQLPPVGDKFIFQCNNLNPYALIIGNPLWELFRGYKLIEIMRQKDDAFFAAALNRLAEGKLTSEDINMFVSREKQKNESVMSPEGTIHLFKSNEEVDRFNISIIKKQPLIVENEASDIVLGNISESAKASAMKLIKQSRVQMTYGLPTTLHLSISIKYMITNNVDVCDGLVNGAVGELKYIEKDKESNAVRLWMYFSDSTIGKNTRILCKQYALCQGIDTDLTPISKVSRNIQLRKNAKVTVMRKQFPLIPAEGMTIYKSQGGTFQNIEVHLTKGMRRNELYVACSRATSLHGIVFDGKFTPPLPPSSHDPISRHVKTLIEKKPVIESVKFLQDYKNVHMSFAFHNVQSLNAHSEDIKVDKCLISADLLLFVETWTKKFDDIDIPSHTIVFRFETEKTTRNPYGIIILKKNEFAAKMTLVFQYNTEEKNKTCNMISFLCKDYCFCVLYKPPNTLYSSIRKQLENMIDRALQTDLRIILIGDFNIDYITEPSNPCFTYLRNNNFQLAVPKNKPSTNGKTQIDLCFSTFQEIDVSYYECYYSYHKPIVGLVNQTVDKGDPNKSTFENCLTLIQTNTHDKQEDLVKKIQQPSISAKNLKGSQTQPLLDEVNLPSGFNNTDNVSCYCNSVCQVLFHKDNLLQDIIVQEINNPLGHLAKSFLKRNCVLDSKPLRSYLDEMRGESLYRQLQQQDAAECLTHLIQVSSCISNSAIHTYTILRRCTGCFYEHRESLPNHVLGLEVLNGNQVQTLAELYNIQINVWTPKDPSRCSSCGDIYAKEEMTIISNPRQLFILSLGLWEEIGHQMVKKSISLKNVPKDTLIIDGEQYAVTAAIFHHGQTMDSGHYTAMLRNNNKWIKANDEVVQRSVWPRNAKDAYIFVCSPCNDLNYFSL